MRSFSSRLKKDQSTSPLKSFDCWLMVRGANPNDKSFQGNSLFVLASSWNWLSIVCWSNYPTIAEYQFAYLRQTTDQQMKLSNRYQVEMPSNENGARPHPLSISFEVSRAWFHALFFFNLPIVSNEEISLEIGKDFPHQNKMLDDNFRPLCLN